jgi:hypothetical protein
LACAAAASFDLFITNDARLQSKHVQGIQFVVSLDRAPFGARLEPPVDARLRSATLLDFTIFLDTDMFVMQTSSCYGRCQAKLCSAKGAGTMTDTVVENFQPSPKELRELERVTRAYAKFSRDAVGLGHVLGGGLLFLSVYLLHHIQLGMFGRLLLGAAPFAWIFGKEWLREHYYQFSGRVTQRRRVWESPLQALLAGVIAFTSLTATGFVIYSLLRSFSWWLVPSSLVYIALLLAMPFIVWRYLRAPYEFVVGVALFALSAILLSGSSLAGTPRAALVRGFMVLAEVVALVMVLVGLVEHMEFLKLRRKMRALKEAA